MKKTVFTFVVFLVPFICFAEQRAVTDKGEEVILYDDGRWEYVGRDGDDRGAIEVNDREFAKPQNATFLLKSKRNNIGLWLDPTKWRFKDAQSNKDAEYELSLKGQDLYGMILTEKIEMPLESLVNIAFQNAEAVAPDVQIINREYRIVNGNKVIQMQMNGTMEGIKFVYYGYYISNKEGSTQILTYTSQGLFDQFHDEMEELLNGLVILE